MTTPADPTSHALSFAGVADAYERARPGYPEEAVAWLLAGDDGHDREPQRVVELGAGTGKLTAGLAAGDRSVVATDPLDQMLRYLVRNVPGAHVVQGTAEQIPVRRRWADVVVVGQAYHWFDRDRALPEIARVLRPGGRIALTWNFRDDRIPWVKRLGRIIGTQDQDTDPTLELLATGLFGFVEQAQFRFWQPLRKEQLRDLVASRSYVAVMDPLAQERLLRKVDELYDANRSGPDGVLLPYVTRCYRAVVRPRGLIEEPEHSADLTAAANAVREAKDAEARGEAASRPVEDPATTLIDFR